jgi:hypothetical protein
VNAIQNAMAVARKTTAARIGITDIWFGSGLVSQALANGGQWLAHLNGIREHFHTAVGAVGCS